MSFNPRTPCGVRLNTQYSLLSIVKFQSTHSLRSATTDYLIYKQIVTVSIHALLAECDNAGTGPEPDWKKFQSTHSLRSATLNVKCDGDGNYVSIHALLAECDLEGESEPCHIFGFNPRTPCGVRHNAGGLHMSIFRVSIHALLAECDINDLLQCKGKRSFNPRTPCGVRQARSHEEWRGYVFQSTHSLRSATSTNLHLVVTI